MMNNALSMLEISDGQIGYRSGKEKVCLIDDVNVSLPRGELVALIGKNGSGKTTLLNTLMRQQELLAGRISLAGRNIEEFHRTELAKTIGFVSTRLGDYGEMKVSELIRIGRYPYTDIFGTLSPDDTSRIAESLSICRISQLSDRKLNTLSDGERQRAMLARLFAQDTDVMLFDEPTSFLDIPNKFEIFSILKNLSREGKSVLLSTHDLNLASLFADKIWILNKKMIIQGTPEDLCLSGEINSLFENQSLHFNQESGVFKIDIPVQKSVSVNVGKDCLVAANWTRRAFERNGIAFDENFKAKPDIYISKEKNTFVWTIWIGEKEKKLFSIEELLLTLTPNKS